MYILSDDCESEPEAGLAAPAPAAPWGDWGGCRASAGRSGKPKLGLLKGTYRKTMRQIRCRLYKGINTKRAGRQPVFWGSTEQILGAGPTRCPLAQRHEHSTVPAAPGPGARDQAPACLSRLGVGDPLTVHGATQELLHVPRHIHRVFQVKITLGVQYRVRAVGGRR